jgi:serine/threonine protein kinase
MEQQRFLNFAREAGLLFADGKLCATLRVNPSVLQEALMEMKNSMESFEEAQEKYNACIPYNNTIDWDDHKEPQTDVMSLLFTSLKGRLRTGSEAQLPKDSRLNNLTSIGERVSNSARKLSTVLTDRKRLSWVAVDQKRLEALLSKLGHLNSFLGSLLDFSQVAKLEKSLERSYLEMLQIRNDLKDLKILTEALESHGAVVCSGTSLGASNPQTLIQNSIQECVGADERRREYIRNLTAIKMDRLEIDATNNLSHELHTSNADNLLNMSSIVTAYSDHKRGTRNIIEERTIFFWNGRSIWVEWMSSASTRFAKEYKSGLTRKRASMLASLLRKELPPGFQTPPCLGYVVCENENVESMLGLVFEQASSLNLKPRLTTLRQLLGQRPKPPLSKRIALSASLAECVQSFHLVDWLHKGLRSHNIIFLGDLTIPLDLSRPYITGFDLSRPGNEGDMTIKPATDLLLDLYRHPRTQSGDADNPYRKCYDLYSLGIVLLEIIYWRPVEDILHIWPSSLTQSSVRQVKSQLLGPGIDNPYPANGDMSATLKSKQSPYLQKAAHKGGDAYRYIIERCLAADEIEKLLCRDDLSSALHHRLYAALNEDVATRLRSMKQALELSTEVNDE